MIDEEGCVPNQRVQGSLRNSTYAAIDTNTITRAPQVKRPANMSATFPTIGPVAITINVLYMERARKNAIKELVAGSAPIPTAMNTASLDTGKNE